MVSVRTPPQPHRREPRPRTARAERGDAHIMGNFQYTILEMFDPKSRAKVIIQRETFWKKASDTRRMG